MSGRPWTPDDIATLKSLVDSGATKRDAEKQLNRSYYSIKQTATLHGFKWWFIKTCRCGISFKTNSNKFKLCPPCRDAADRQPKATDAVINQRQCVNCGEVDSVFQLTTKGQCEPCRSRQHDALVNFKETGAITFGVRPNQRQRLLDVFMMGTATPNEFMREAADAWIAEFRHGERCEKCKEGT